jgi:hypothetical protein
MNLTQFFSDLHNKGKGQLSMQIIANHILSVATKPSSSLAETGDIKSFAPTFLSMLRIELRL